MFLIFSLGFFRAGVFDNYLLDLHLCSSIVKRAMTSGVANIQVSDHGARF